MRHGLALVALLLPLSGCVVPPQPVGYGYGYPQDSYAAEYSYPGYAYNGGSPTLYVDGATLPLIFYGGGWGYWDGFRRWHRAPEGIERNLLQRHPGGVGFRPFGGGQFGRSEGFRPEGGRPEGFRSEGLRPDGFRGGPRPEGFRPEGPRFGGNPGGFPGGRPPGGFRPEGQPGVQRAAVPQNFAPRPAPLGRPAGAPPERHRQDEHR